MRRIRTMVTVEEETMLIAKTKARKHRRSAAKKGKDGSSPGEPKDAPTNLTDTLMDAAGDAVAKVEELMDTATDTIKAAFEPASATPKEESSSRVRVAKPRGQKKPLVVPQVVR